MSTTDTSFSDHSLGSESWSRTHFSLGRRSAGNCRVTFDHPPLNTITATTVAELAELVGLIEQDPDLNVVVFDSAKPRLPPRPLRPAVRSEFPPALTDFFERLTRPAQQAQSARLRELGWGIDSDLERSLGRRVVESAPDA
jgi:hypothetical protein